MGTERSHTTPFDDSDPKRETLPSTSEQVSQVGIWTWDMRSAVVTWSDGVYRIFDLDPDHHEPSLEAFDASIHPDDIDAFARVRESVFRTGKMPVFPCRIVRADGGVRDVVLNGHLETDDQGELVRSVGAIIDVTDRNRLESQLRQAQKLDLLGKLAGGAAHDFQNVLSSIHCLASALEEALDQQGLPDLRRHATSILAAAANGTTVSSRLMSFVRNERRELVPCRLQTLMLESEAMLRASIDQRITLRFTVPERPIIVMGTHAELLCAILNLAFNARDAIRDSGEILITADVVEIDDDAGRRMLIPCEQGRYVSLSVADTGDGIPQADLGYIFDSSFTTKDPELGSGLGLMSVLQVVQTHFGGISVASEIGQGTNISMLIPVAE